MPTIAWEAEPNPALVTITEEGWLTVQDMFTVDDVEIRVDRENLSGGPVLTTPRRLSRRTDSITPRAGSGGLVLMRRFLWRVMRTLSIVIVQVRINMIVTRL